MRRNRRKLYERNVVQFVEFFFTSFFFNQVFHYTSENMYNKRGVYILLFTMKPWQLMRVVMVQQTHSECAKMCAVTGALGQGLVSDRSLKVYTKRCVKLAADQNKCRRHFADFQSCSASLTHVFV